MQKLLKTFIFVILSLHFGLICVGCHRETSVKGGIIALTPSLTEAVWAVGTPEHMPLVATSPYTTDVRANGLERLQAQGSLERIVAMQPSLVLLHPSDSQLAGRLEALGIPVMASSMDTVADIEATLQALGRRLARAQEAAQAIEKMRAEMMTKTQKSAEPVPQILLIIDRLDMRMQQFYTAQPPAFIAELVEGCGYEVLRIKSESWSQLSAEDLMVLNPDRILFLARSSEDAKQVSVEFDRVLGASLDAVGHGQFYVYDDPGITVPGPEMGRRQRKLCQWLKAQ